MPQGTVVELFLLLSPYGAKAHSKTPCIMTIFKIYAVDFIKQNSKVYILHELCAYLSPLDQESLESTFLPVLVVGFKVHLNMAKHFND